MEERIQVHHNYISAISNRECKKDLINRLKISDPHNIPAYEAEMTCHMVMHDDVLGRILTILKQDDYYRILEELPVINSLTAYAKSSSSLNCMTPPPSLRKSPVRQISSKGNLGNQVCTPDLKLHYLLLRVLYQDLLPHFSLLHQIHHQNQLTHTI